MDTYRVKIRVVSVSYEWWNVQADSPEHAIECAEQGLGDHMDTQDTGDPELEAVEVTLAAKE